MLRLTPLLCSVRVFVHSVTDACAFRDSQLSRCMSCVCVTNERPDKFYIFIRPKLCARKMYAAHDLAEHKTENNVFAWQNKEAASLSAYLCLVKHRKKNVCFVFWKIKNYKCYDFIINSYLLLVCVVCECGMWQIHIIKMVLLQMPLRNCLDDLVFFFGFFSCSVFLFTDILFYCVCEALGANFSNNRITF